MTPFVAELAVPPPLPLTVADTVIRLLAVLMLIGINAFFVAAEFSIVAVRRSRIIQLVSGGDVQAKTVQSLQRSIDRLLSTTQLGITLSSLALGWIGEGTMALVIAHWLSYLNFTPAATAVTAHSLAIPLAFISIAYLQIVLGELCPKSLALLYPEELARFLGAPSLTIAQFFSPFIWVLNQSTRLLLRCAGITYTAQNTHTRLTPEELQIIISTSTESPGLEAEQRELLNNIFEFREVSVGEVMVPRPHISTIPQTGTFRDLLSEMSASGYSRYPVIGDSLDDIRGIIYFKELAAPLGSGKLNLETPIANWIRPARFVPEYMPLHELLHLMQRTRQTIVIVVDEFGGTAGLLTLQDVTDEIIGGSDEADIDEDVVVRTVDDQTYLVQAQTEIEMVNERLDLAIPLIDEYQTLGGFLIYHAKKIPLQGESFQYQNLNFTVVSADGPRLQEIRIQIHPLQKDSSISSAIRLSQNTLSPSSQNRL
ncbi:MAG: hemolysin family protein [Cyanobacteria bacterium P01_H01_bin.119]